MAGHAILSPSGAHRWMVCAAAPAMEAPFPESSSPYADEGTAAHFIASSCLLRGSNPSIFTDCVIELQPGGVAVRNAGFTSANPHIPVSSDMIRHVQSYVDFVRSLPGMLLAEEELPIGHITGEENATGTCDAVVLSDYVLRVVDFKYGFQAVPAEGNPQLRMYALGALAKHGLLSAFEKVEMYIHQPRVRAEPDLEVLTVSELVLWGNDARVAARLATVMLDGLGPLSYNPNEKACQWCKAKATCPALSKYIEDVVGASFEDLTKDSVVALVPSGEVLGSKLDVVDLIEQWCKAIRGEVERKLLAGLPVTGYKLVQGKRGNRKWRDEAEVEAVFSSMRLKVEEKYDMKLISPTSAEKLLAESPKRWERVLPLITQTEGQPSVAKESDKRPAYDPQAKPEEFSHVVDAEALI